MWVLTRGRAHSEPCRVALTVLAFAAVIAVLLVLEGFRQGLLFQLEQLVLQRGGDLIATQSSVANFIAVRSSLPQLSRQSVEQVDGVAAAHPLTAAGLIYDSGDERTPIYLVTYGSKGGPRQLVAGHLPETDTEIVIDASLARIHDLGVGDALVLGSYTWRISGVSEGETAFMMPLAFITYDGLIEWLIASDAAPDLGSFPLLSFLLVDLDGSAPRDAVRQTIEAHVPDLDVYSPEQLARRDVELGRVFFAPILGLLIAAAWLAGMLVVAMVTYVDVAAGGRRFGVMKALGFTNRQLAATVLLDGLTAAIVAIPLGMVLAWAIAMLIHVLAPLYELRVFEPAQIGRTVLMSLAFALAGGLVPLRTLLDSDPLIVFREA